jgi:hypothetical protein
LLDTVTRLPQPQMKWDLMAAVLRNVPGVQVTALENWPMLSGAQHNDRGAAQLRRMIEIETGLILLNQAFPKHRSDVTKV